MPGAILLTITGWDPAPWVSRFRMLAPDRDIRVWPDTSAILRISPMPARGSRPPAQLAAFPNLKAIFSLGAGVDHLIADPMLPDVPVVRIVDQTLRSA